MKTKKKYNLCILKLLKPNPPEYTLYGIYSYEQEGWVRKPKENIGNMIGKIPMHNTSVTTPYTKNEKETTLKSSISINYTIDKWLDETPILLKNLVDQDNGPLKKDEDNFTNQPWWLEPLETPTKRHYEEFNNYKNTYLCNSVWWEVPNSFEQNLYFPHPQMT
ncbi:19415_t:CDS:2 [Dentiscutata erythropus]|uniref:19415_t:CDS:1 n=1 Tax=Dentiscutata erythropus TaxID=1348616 RepID=A0A9N9F8D1_9GLOM|nr:19415_t:CDS:2 [Dentiscutata erythropus]